MWEIPPWIASRSYFTGTEKARTIITNSRWDEYLVLEDLSSDMWAVLPEIFTVESLKEPLAEVGIDLGDAEHLEEVKNFLESLRQSNCLVLDGADNPQKTVTDNPVRQEIRQIPQIKSKFCEGLQKEGILSSLGIDLTFRCVEKCVHCFNPKYQCEGNGNNELTAAQWKTLLQEAADMGVESVAFTGGEVFLRDDIFDILAEIKRLKFCFTIATNGQLLTEEKIRQLAALYPAEVAISIYSANPEIHDVTTGIDGSWEKSINALKLLRQYSINIAVKNPLMNHTVHGFKELLNLCKELKAAPQFDTTISPSTDGYNGVCVHQILDKEVLAQVYREKNMLLYVGLPEDGKGNGQRMSPVDDNLCGAGFYSLSICPDGTVYPCNSLPIELGKLFNPGTNGAGLKDIWENSPALKAWNELTAQETDECGLYAKCMYCNYCAGLAMLEHNDLLRSHQATCTMAEVRMNIAKSLSQGIDPLVEYEKKYGQPFGYDLTFREALAPSACGGCSIINHSGEDFIAKVKSLKQTGNRKRKEKQCEPDSPQDLYNRGTLRKENNPVEGKFYETGR
jgi:radical SAM protein with 4Fe4S-binding SPASM domain